MDFDTFSPSRHNNGQLCMTMLIAVVVVFLLLPSLRNSVLPPMVAAPGAMVRAMTADHNGSTVINVKDDTEAFKEASKGGKTCCFFISPHCGHCQKYLGNLDCSPECKEFEKVLKCDVTKCPEMARVCGCTHTPQCCPVPPLKEEEEANHEMLSAMVSGPYYGADDDGNRADSYASSY